MQTTEAQAKYKLYKRQGDFLTCPDRFTAFIGGIGSGKSFAGAVKTLIASRPKGTLGMVIAPTYTMLKDATFRTFIDIARPVVEDYNKSNMTVKIKNGGEILFRSADNPERLRGSNLNYVWMDEGALCPPDTWDIVIGRLRADGKAGDCWITTTPKGRNWLYQKRQDITIFKARTRDNPYLAKEFITSLETSYSGEFARQELEGEFISLEGLVYPMFTTANIQQRNEAEFSTWYLAMDEGYTNPAVILLVGEDGDGRLHIAKEFYERGKLQEYVVNHAATWATAYKIRFAAVDAAAAGLIADLKNNNVPAEPHKGRVMDGIQQVQNLLQVQGDGRPRLTVDPNCTNTINEFESYVWRAGKDEPVKENDHALDAARYLVNALTRKVNHKIEVFENPFF